jgi:hypothetical protein
MLRLKQEKDISIVQAECFKFQEARKAGHQLLKFPASFNFFGKKGQFFK